MCHRFGYTFDMSVYLGKQKNNADTGITPTHGSMLELVHKVEGVGHKIFMDNYFTSPKLFNDLLSRKINACGTVRHNRKGMPLNFSPKELKMKKRRYCVEGEGDTQGCMLEGQTGSLCTPVEGNFKTGESNKARHH